MYADITYYRLLTEYLSEFWLMARAGHRRNSGFTILELLTVLAVVGLALWIFFVTVTNARTASRDATRLAELGEITKALNIYYSNNGRFPISTTQTTITGTDEFSRALQGDLAIKEMPRDPLYPEYSYTYISSADGTDYLLTFCLETNSIRGYKDGCDNTMKP